MGVVIPQVVSEDRASGAQIVDGGLRFDSGLSQYLSRTASAGNQTTFTWSSWVKFSNLSGNVIFGEDGGYPNCFLWHDSDGTLRFSAADAGSTVFLNLITTQVFRDFSSWYHIVAVYDSSNATSTDRARLYVNGTRITAFSTSTYPNSSVATCLNASGNLNRIGQHSGVYYYDGYISTAYFIDGQALDPSYFGYTDPLTNTWRPKLYKNTTALPGDSGSAVGFGTNGFYLPFDGSAPIGQDQSGRGNNWTPVNFGGSNTIEKATGALPILNTDGGGKVARVGVRTDANASSLVLALPLVGIKSDFSNAINSGTSNKAITNVGSMTFPSGTTGFYDSAALCGSGKVLRAESSADFNFGTGDFTVEYWLYRTSLGSNDATVTNYSQVSSGYFICLHSNSTDVFLFLNGSSVCSGGTPQANVWNHYAFVRSGTTCTIYKNGIAITSATSSAQAGATNVMNIGAYSDGTSYISGYIQDFRIYKGLAKYTSNFIPASTDPDIVPDSPSGVSYSSNVALVPSTDGAVAFDGSGDYLSISSPPTDIRDWYTNTNFTLEYFVYANAFGSSANGGSNVLGHGNTGTTEEYWSFGPKSGGTVIFYYWSGSQNSFSTTQTLSIGKWHHLAFVKSSTSLKIYIDGIESASSTLSVTPQSSASLPFLIGKVTSATEFNGFISNINLVNGTALYTSNFTPPSAPISSVANTKLLCCKSNSSATAADVTPGTITANGNAAATNFNPFTVNINTQRGKQSGYCTWNPLSNSAGSLSNGNLRLSGTSSAYVRCNGTISVSSGKWYFETTLITPGSSEYTTIGIGQGNITSQYPGQDSLSYAYTFGQGTKINNNSQPSYGTALTTSGDVFMCAFDLDSSKLYFGKNGVWMEGGNPTAGTNPSYTLSSGSYTPIGRPYDASAVTETNFGQKPFKFPPPAGFQPLTLANTPRPTIVRPDQYVGIATYTGNGATQTVSGLGFKPDFLWLKSRNNAFYHRLYDSIRGVTKALYSNATDTEGAYQTTYENLTSFDRNGFTLGTVTIEDGINKSNSTMVAWAWKAGGNSNTYNINDVGYATASAAGLTAGNSNLVTGASVNTKSGFSIITYSSSTTPNIPHGLGRNVSFIIAKSRTVGVDWVVYHRSLGKDKLLVLNGTSGELSVSNYWGTSEPNDTVFGTYGTGSNSNNQGNMVAYCWAEIPGFSKFGSYSGNSSADGVYVATGFRPRWLLVKKSSSTGNERGWVLVDSERSKFNVSNLTLFPHASSAEDAGTYIAVDFLSNGFKLRSTEEAANASYTYIYACFAETPSFNLYGAMSNAR